MVTIFYKMLGLYILLQSMYYVLGPNVHNVLGTSVPIFETTTCYQIDQEINTVIVAVAKKSQDDRSRQINYYIHYQSMGTKPS